jgi:hypothetical protein
MCSSPSPGGPAKHDEARHASAGFCVMPDLLRHQIRIGRFLRRHVGRRLASHNPRENGVQLPHAFRQRRRPELQNVSRFHLVKVTARYRIDRLPAFTRANFLVAHFAAAP